MDIIKNGSCNKIRFVCFECECIFDAKLGKNYSCTNKEICF